MYIPINNLLTYLLIMEKILLAIQALLKISVSQTWQPLEDIKKVIFWDPKILPEDSLPALTIMPIWTEYVMRGSQYDEKTHQIEIKLIYNSKSFFSNNPDPEKIQLIKDATQKAENTDINWKTLPYTIAWTIQTNTTLNGTCKLSHIENISYWFNNDRWFPTYEITVTLIAIEIANR